MSLWSHFFNRKEQLIGTEGSAREAGLSDDVEENFDEDNAETNEKDTVESEVENQETEEIYEVLEREILPTKIICPDCGGITLEGLELCDKCGGELL